MFSPLPVLCADGITRPSCLVSRLQESDMHNVAVLECFYSLPPEWRQWDKKQSLKDTPLMQQFKIDVLRVPKQLGAFEPAQTQNLLTYKVFLVSNEMVVVH